MITAENNYTKEYLEAHRRYYRASKAYKNYRQAHIIELIVNAVFLIWSLNRISSPRILRIVFYVFCIYFICRIIACLYNMWNLFFSRKRLIPDSFHRRFIFGDDTFGMLSQTENYYAERYKRYPSMHSAVEWEDWFFINFNAVEVCIIKNTDLTEGTPEKLRLLLKDKLGSRFHQKGSAK